MHFPAAGRARRQYTESYIIRSIYKTDIKSGLHIVCLHLLGPGHSRRLAGDLSPIPLQDPGVLFAGQRLKPLFRELLAGICFRKLLSRIYFIMQAVCLNQDRKPALSIIITNNCLSRQLSHRPHGYKDSQTGHRELYINSAVLNGLYPQSRYWNLPSGPVPGQPGPESERRHGKRTPR